MRTKTGFAYFFCVRKNAVEHRLAMKRYNRTLLVRSNCEMLEEPASSIHNVFQGVMLYRQTGCDEANVIADHKCGEEPARMR